VSDGPHLKLAEVSVLPVVTTLDVNVDRILQAALDAKLSQVVIVGLDADGEFYFCSSKADGGDVLWELEKAKLKLLGAIA
jgi:hypothetical protein